MDASCILPPSRAVAQATGDVQTVADALVLLGMTTQDKAQVGAMRTLYKQSATLAREIGYKWGEAFALFWLGHAWLASGDL